MCVAMCGALILVVLVATSNVRRPICMRTADMYAGICVGHVQARMSMILQRSRRRVPSSTGHVCRDSYRHGVSSISRTRVCTHMSTHMSAHTSIHTSAHMSAHTSIHTSMHTSAHTSMHTSAHTCLRARRVRCQPLILAVLLTQVEFVDLPCT